MDTTCKVSKFKVEGKTHEKIFLGLKFWSKRVKIMAKNNLLRFSQVCFISFTLNSVTTCRGKTHGKKLGATNWVQN